MGTGGRGRMNQQRRIRGHEASFKPWAMTPAPVGLPNPSRAQLTLRRTPALHPSPPTKL
jgi:hypothetical protein